MIGGLLRMMVIIGLIRLLIATERPFLCAQLYVVFGLVINLIMLMTVSAQTLAGLVVALGVLSVVRFLLAAGYFWLLNRFEESGLLWWAIALVGFVPFCFL